MANLPKGYEDESAAATATVGRERNRDGDYIKMVKNVTYEKTKGGPALIIEYRVVEAKKLVPDVEPNAVGTDVSDFYPDYGEAAVMLKPNLKAFVVNLLGLDAKMPKEEVAKWIARVCNDEQIARGMYVRAVSFHTTKKGDGEDFMGFNSHPVPGENTPDAASVRARRAQLEAEQPSGGSAGASAGGAPALPGTAPALPGAANGKPYLAGWTQHPQNPTFWFKDGVVKPEAELAAAYAPALPVTPAIPTIPALPNVPALPVAAKNPLEGWTQHPSNPAYWFKDGAVKLEADIRAGK